MADNLREEVNLIGFITDKLDVINSLPTIKQVLALLFYNIRRLSKSLEDSAKLTVRECLTFWSKAGIPTQEEKKCVLKLKAEHTRWYKIHKNSDRKTVTQKKNEELYIESINKLFDISRADAFEMIDDNTREFLLRHGGN